MKRETNTVFDYNVPRETVHTYMLCGDSDPPPPPSPCPDINTNTTSHRAALYNATDFETQNVTCTLTASAGNGENASFALSFRQDTTGWLGGNSSLLDLEEALESLSTIGDVEASDDRKTQSTFFYMTTLD